MVSSKPESILGNVSHKIRKLVCEQILGGPQELVKKYGFNFRAIEKLFRNFD